MAVLNKGGAVTMSDIAKSMAPDGTVAAVIELLNQSNELLTDMGWVEGNTSTGMRTTVRTGIPKATWRRLYKGVQPVKTQRTQLEVSCGLLEQRSEVDVDIADMNGNTDEFRLSEADGIIEGINQTMMDAVIYGDLTVNPDRFNGLTPIYSSLSAGSGKNIIDAGGTGSDNTSIWLVVWGENTITGIYPKGSKAGLTHKDLGEIDAFDENQARFRAYADLWGWKCGLAVRDWRYAVRIANVDVSDLVGLTGTQASTASTAIIKLMIKAMARIPSMGKGRAAFYANRTVKEMLSVAALDKSQNVLAVQAAANQFGTVAPGSVAGNGAGISGGTLTFLGVPVRTVDTILETEARVT